MKIIKISLFGAFLALMAWSCSTGENGGQKNEPGSEVVATSKTNKEYLVKTEAVKREAIVRNIPYTANLKPFEELNFAPSQPGRINSIQVEVGDRVRKGDLIVEMDRTQLIQAQEQYQNALSNYRRMDTLYQLNSVSEQQYEGAKTQYEVAKANYDFLRSNTTLQAPMNAVITGKYYESGELYSGAPNAATGKAAIVTLMQINPLKAIINVSEKYYPEIKNGMAATVMADVYPDKTFVGEVYKVYPIINPETRSFQVELKVNNPSELLRPGMFCRVNINIGEKEALVVPASSVLQQEGTNNRYLFVVNGDGKAQKVGVEITERINGKVAVVSDKLQQNDRVVTAGQEKLMEGVPVKIVE